MSNILGAIILAVIIALAAYDIITAIDCNSGIEAACEIRRNSSAYEAKP
jgi:hypothetical protein